jgi:hypothetical protein
LIPSWGSHLGTTDAGERKAVIRRRLLPAEHAGVARSFEAQRRKARCAERRDGRPDLLDATLRLRAQTGEHGKATELLRRREVLIPKRLKLKLEREICRGGFESWNV